MSAGEAVASATAGPIGAAISVISNRENTRLSRLLGAGMLASSAYTLYKKWKSNARSKTAYTVAVYEDDPIYPDLHTWLLAELPPADQRALIVKTTYGYGGDLVGPSGGPPPGVRLFYDGGREHTITIGGYPVDVTIDRPDSAGGSSDKAGGWGFRKPDRIVFQAYGHAARDAVVTTLRDLAAKMKKEPTPHSYVASRWGGWSCLDDVPPRPIESVILRGGAKEEVIEDLQAFLAAERTYIDLGMPWHRSYLFHGPPGTGKTSIAKAIAVHLGLDLRYIPLSAVADDSVLNELLGGVGPRSVLLLEDIDIAKATKEREGSDDTAPSEAKGVTLAGLLNGLDGVATPHGLIVMMTTNRPEQLDSALTRAGRVDLSVPLGYVDDDQLARLVAHVVGRKVDLPPLGGRQLTPATIVEVFKRRLDDEQAGLAALAAMLQEPAKTGLFRLGPEPLIRTGERSGGSDAQSNTPPGLTIRN